jgi:archaellum component FlaC
VRTDLEGQLAGQSVELQKIGEQLQQEMNVRRQIEADFGKATQEFKAIRADLEGQLSTRTEEMQKVGGQLQREITERKKAVEAMQQSVAQFWTLMDSVEKIISDLGRDSL